MLLPEEPEVLDSRDLTALNLSEKRAFGALSKTITTKQSLFCWVLGIAGRERANCTEVDLPMGTCKREPLDSHAGEREQETSYWDGMQPLPAFFFFFSFSILLFSLECKGEQRPCLSC